MCDPTLENACDPIPFLDQFDFHARLAELQGITIVAFTSISCGSCRHLHRVLLEVKSAQPTWHLFEVDAARDQALTNEFQVFHLPTIFLFINGSFHHQLQAEARSASIIEAVQAARAQPAEEAP